MGGRPGGAGARGFPFAVLGFGAALIVVLLAMHGGLPGLGGFREGEARACRLALPALNAPGAALTLSRSSPGPYPSSLRIDYLAADPGRPPRPRFVICRYGPAGPDGQRPLAGIATEQGPLPDASFYLMQRFYLSSPEAADPAPLSGRAEVPSVPFGVAYAAQQALLALPKAATYALLAAAYALIYGLAGRIVLMFGEFAVIASVAGLAGAAAAGSGGTATPLIAFAAAVAAGLWAAGLHGYAVGRIAIAPLMRSPGLNLLIATVGLSIGLSEYLRLATGARPPPWLPPLASEPLALLRSGDFVVTVSAGTLMLGLGGLGAAAAVAFGLGATQAGRNWRALSEDPVAAALCGVDGARVRDQTFLLATMMAGLAGLIMTALFGGLGHTGGFALGLKALVAAVLGGIGSVPGAMLGGLALAGIETAWSSLMPIEARDIALYAILSLVLIVRPGGFFGHADSLPRRV